MITFRKFLKEAIIDPMQKTLDKAVFLNPYDENAKINPEIKSQVINGIRRFEAICPVHKYYLTGSILSHRYNKDSDLDVEVEILNSDADSDEIVDSLYDTLDALNGSLAGQSTHPINYHLSFVDEDDDLSDDADNIYNFETDSWDKKMASDSRISQARSEAIRGVNVYQNSYGQNVDVSVTADHVYENRYGDVYGVSGNAPDQELLNRMGVNGTVSAFECCV